MIKSFLNKFLSTSSAAATPKSEPITHTMGSNKIYLYEANQHELEKVLESPELPGKAPGYVYFVQEYMNGSFKIGKTKNIEKRMNIFGVKLPFENKLIHLIKTGNHHQTEAAFHKHFSEKRLEGEWFALNKEDITWIKNGIYTPEIIETISMPAIAEPKAKKSKDTDDNLLTAKQLEFAKTLLAKLDSDYELVAEHAALTQKDLNRLSGYFRFKNKGALNNLVSSGVLKEK